MPRQPERPFVPHHTPTTGRPPVSAPEFRLYRPFLPGGDGPLRPIVDFVDTAPTARDHPQNFYAGEAEEEPDELPPVEHFLDPLPPIDRFAPEAERNLSGAPSEAGWGETDWQHYDWRAAAALGETGVDAASTAWDATDWDRTGHRAREPRQSAAQAIATALDEIARRIREGDLSSSGPGPMTDPATIAATLAALLGVRR